MKGSESKDGGEEASRGASQHGRERESMWIKFQKELDTRDQTGTSGLGVLGRGSGDNEEDKHFREKADVYSQLLIAGQPMSGVVGDVSFNIMPFIISCTRVLGDNSLLRIRPSASCSTSSRTGSS